MSACSQTVRVPTGDGGDSVHASTYRINTTDGRTYRAEEYIVNDSTLVITRAWHPTESPDDGPAVPFAIRRDQVASVELVAPDLERTVLVVVCGTLLVIAAWVIGAHGAFEGGN